MRHPFPPGATVFVRNPVSGRPSSRRRSARMAARLAERGYEVLETDGPGRAGSLAREAVERGALAVGCFGGDGSVYETCAELPSSIPIAYFPTGTANLLGRNLGLPFDADVWFRLLERGTTRDVRFGTTGDRRFAACASVGFDARVVARVPRDLKKRVQEAAYVWTLLREARGWTPPGLRVIVDGRPHPRPALGVLIGRGPHYAGPFRLFPDASPEDPRLHALLIEGTRLSQALPFAVGVVRGRAGAGAGVVRVRAECLEVVSDAPSEVELDGDPYGETPVRFSVEGDARRVLAPAQSTSDATDR